MFSFTQVYRVSLLVIIGSIATFVSTTFVAASLDVQSNDLSVILRVGFSTLSHGAGAAGFLYLFLQVGFHAHPVIANGNASAFFLVRRRPLLVSQLLRLSRIIKLNLIVSSTSFYTNHGQCLICSLVFASMLLSAPLTLLVNFLPFRLCLRLIFFKLQRLVLRYGVWLPNPLVGWLC
jgi:hypothetical protein